MDRETVKKVVDIIEKGICEKKFGIAKHWEVIKAFAKGANIQVETLGGWVDEKEPHFYEDCHYRVKPETPRWRAYYGESYWSVKLLSSFPCNVYEDKDYQLRINDLRYEVGNYFKSKEEAQLVADCINKIFEFIREGVPVSEIEVKVDKTDGANKANVKEDEKN